MGQGWQETALWREMERRGDQASAISDAIKPLLGDLDTLLASGATGDLNFTLHDDEHAFRVAERIAELLGNEQLQAISSFDIGFSLAAAYGHDIGMTPDRGKVQKHFNALASSNGMDALSADDADAFQEWLDDERDGLVPPLVDGQPSEAELREARLIVAHYARHRHNDWSGEWLRAWAERNNATASLYPGWIEDLVQICRSHHEGYEHLASRAFAPRRVGNPAEVLHLRHCAALLRVADVLEIDPERTPDVVFERRAVDETSEIFWHKDHVISVTKDGTGYTITARPPNSAIHHAVVQTIAGIDAELQLCRRLADEQPFNVIANSTDPLPNRWELDPRTKSEIEPRDDSYVYVDGTFRPDVRRVLQLLGGVELYGTEWAAVRELLQNAFDAVKEQIARERLGWDDPNDEAGVDHLRRRHKVTLELLPAEDGDGLILRCTDTGVGMSKERIVQRFLVSGSGKRHDDRELERACAEAGFAPEKTARFGIGVLSYFLLGDKIVVETRRSPITDDADRTAWHFETAGPGTFGELTRANRVKAGTTVEIALRRGVGDETLTGIAAGLHDYLVKIVRRVPCTFRFDDAVGDDSFSWAPGWAPFEEPRQEDEVFAEALSRVEKTLMTADQREAHDRLGRWLEREAAEYFDSRRWIVEEGPLPDDLGTYEIRVPWFETEYGPCLVGFARLDEEAPPQPIGARGAVSWSWNGMHVQADMGPTTVKRRLSADPLFRMRKWNWEVRVDLTANGAGTPSVSRQQLNLTHTGKAAARHVGGRLRAIVQRFATDNMAADTALLNCALAEVSPSPLAPRCWMLGAPGRARWQSFNPPAIAANWDQPIRLRWRAQPMLALHRITVRGSSYQPIAIPLLADAIVGYRTRHGVGVTELWTQTDDGLLFEGDRPLHARFPAAWGAIAALFLNRYRSRNRLVFNREHAAATELANAVQAPDGDRVGGAQGLETLHLRPDLLLEQPDVALAAFAWSVASDSPEFWRVLLEARPDAFNAALAHIRSSPGEKPLMIAAERDDWGFVAYTLTDRGLVKRWLPALGDEDLLQVVND
jgi:hypothetical protein